MNAAFRKGQSFTTPEGVTLEYVGAHGPNIFEFRRLGEVVTTTLKDGTKGPITPENIKVGDLFLAKPGSVFTDRIIMGRVPLRYRRTDNSGTLIFETVEENPSYQLIFFRVAHKLDTYLERYEVTNG